MNDKIYQDELMHHFKYPLNKKEVQSPDFESSHLNPSCGDKVSIQGKIFENKIVDIGFSGLGCVISQAAASMLTESVKGKTVDEVLAITKENIIEMVGIKLGPNRLKCALLALQVLQDALNEFQKSKN